MKRFLTSILCVSVFFIGLATLVEKAGAKFKSDEKALELIRAARAAIGGDSAIANVRSMSIVGKTTHTLKFNGTDRVEQGDTEIALQFPDKFSKMVKIGNGDEGNAKGTLRNKEVVVIGDAPEGTLLPRTSEEPGVQRVIVRKGDGTTDELKGDEVNVIVRKGEGDKIQVSKGGEDPAGEGNTVFIRRGGEPHGAMHRSEFLSTTLSLLLSAPEGMDVSYTYAGEDKVDGTPCNVVQAQVAGATFKLYLGADSSLPLMISYLSNELPRIMLFERQPAPGTDQTQEKITFNAKVPAPESAEVQVKFSDYRSVGGLQLPFRWSKTVNGNAFESLEVANYEINPANIADKFHQPKVFLKTKKEAQN